MWLSDSKQYQFCTDNPENSQLDLLKEYKSYYNAGKNPEIVEFGEANYLTIEGIGEPAGKMFVSKVEALYPLAYEIKKICKEQDKDFGVPKFPDGMMINPRVRDEAAVGLGLLFPSKYDFQISHCFRFQSGSCGVRRVALRNFRFPVVQASSRLALS